MAVVYHPTFDTERVAHLHIADTWDENTAECIARQSHEDAAKPDTTSYSTMSRKQAKDVEQGSQMVRSQDHVMWNTILRSAGKVVLLLTASAQAFTQGNAARCAIAPKLSNDLPIDSYDCIISNLSTVENPTEVLQMMAREWMSQLTILTLNVCATPLESHEV